MEIQYPNDLVIQLDFLDGILLCFFMDSDEPITNLLLELSLVLTTWQQSEPLSIPEMKILSVKECNC